MHILLANPRGFCAGVDRAIDIVERAIDLFGAPIYVRHEVVHNKYVVDRPAHHRCGVRRGAPGSAGWCHGDFQRPRRVPGRSDGGQATVVERVRRDVSVGHEGAYGGYALRPRGREVFLIGHEGHPEVEGTIGQFDTSFGGSIYLVETVEDVERVVVRDPGHLAFVTQTTLSVDDTASIVAALRNRFRG